MKIQTLTYNDGYSTQRLHVLAETKVADVDKAGAATATALADLKPIEREWFASEGDETRLRHEAAEAAREAGRTGAKVDKSLLKKARAAAEAREELELDLAAARARVSASYQRHAVAIEVHAAELIAHADAVVDAGQATLAAASKMARTGDVQLDTGLTVRNALAGVQRGEGFVPRQPSARTAEFGNGGVPGPYIALANENLSTAMGLTAQIVDQFKSEAKLIKLQREADEAPDLHEPDEDGAADAADAAANVDVDVDVDVHEVDVDVHEGDAP